jgi:hypothetical protein
MLLVACSAGCVPRVQSPYFGDENYIRIGLDPDAEAKALISNHAQQGEGLSLRILGHDFTALGFMDRDGHPQHALILTKRGIEVALDPEPGPPLMAAKPSVTYALIKGPFDDTQDADGDGFEEVFIERRTPQRTCLLIYRVRDTGFVDPVEVKAFAFGRELCPSAVADVDHDHHAELLADVSFDEFGLAQTPSVRLPLWAAEHHFQLHAQPEKLRDYVAEQRRGRMAELDDAGERRDRPTVQRIAVELAALAYLDERDAREQMAQLDLALTGVTFPKRERRWRWVAHERISHVWSAPPPKPDKTASREPTARR